MADKFNWLKSEPQTEFLASTGDAKSSSIYRVVVYILAITWGVTTIVFANDGWMTWEQWAQWNMGVRWWHAPQWVAEGTNISGAGRNGPLGVYIYGLFYGIGFGHWGPGLAVATSSFLGLAVVLWLTRNDSNRADSLLVAIAMMSQPFVMWYNRGGIEAGYLTLPLIMIIANTRAILHGRGRWYHEVMVGIGVVVCFQFEKTILPSVLFLIGVLLAYQRNPLMLVRVFIGMVIPFGWLVAKAFKGTQLQFGNVWEMPGRFVELWQLPFEMMEYWLGPVGPIAYWLFVLGTVGMVCVGGYVAFQQRNMWFFVLLLGMTSANYAALSYDPLLFHHAAIYGITGMTSWTMLLTLPMFASPQWVSRNLISRFRWVVVVLVGMQIGTGVASGLEARFSGVPKIKGFWSLGKKEGVMQSLSSRSYEKVIEIIEGYDVVSGPLGVLLEGTTRLPFHEQKDSDVKVAKESMLEQIAAAKYLLAGYGKPRWRELMGTSNLVPVAGTKSTLWLDQCDEPMLVLPQATREHVSNDICGWPMQLNPIAMMSKRGRLRIHQSAGGDAIASEVDPLPQLLFPITITNPSVQVTNSTDVRDNEETAILVEWHEPFGPYEFYGPTAPDVLVMAAGYNLAPLSERDGYLIRTRWFLTREPLVKVVARFRQFPFALATLRAYRIEESLLPPE